MEAGGLESCFATKFRPNPLSPPMKILKNKHPSTKGGVPEYGSFSFFNSFYKHVTYMSYFDCYSLTVSTIYCFSPTLRLFFARNWVLLFINENANRYAQLSHSSYYRFSFFVFLSDICCKINKLFQHFEYQLTKRCFMQLQGRLEGFKISSWFLKIMKLIEYRIAKKCPDFHHCCRWLHHHYSRGCHVRIYLMKQSFTLTT